MLKDSEVTLALAKYYFVYFSIKVLNYYVFKLELNIAKKKINVICRIKFLRNLKELEINLRFFEYYRDFVDHYTTIARLLIKLKIRNFVNSSIKEKSRQKHATRIKLR